MTEKPTLSVQPGGPIVSTAAHALTVICVLSMVVTVRMAITGGSGIPCPVRNWTGIPCPTCGLTRSIATVWKGDLITSWGLHPLGIIAALLVLGYLAITVPCFFSRAWQRRRERLVSSVLRWQMMVLCVLCLMTIWVVRWASGSLRGL